MHRVTLEGSFHVIQELTGYICVDSMIETFEGCAGYLERIYGVESCMLQSRFRV